MLNEQDVMNGSSIYSFQTVEPICASRKVKATGKEDIRDSSLYPGV